MQPRRLPAPAPLLDVIRRARGRPLQPRLQKTLQTEQNGMKYCAELWGNAGKRLKLDYKRSQEVGDWACSGLGCSGIHWDSENKQWAPASVLKIKTFLSSLD